ncbi:hypothetical protein BC829DRAFT_419768 [Chytridium lagenaria]|nr:hypothetical protein BC829DRAFT_419768 [Chytridium lagenaria]
MAGKDEAPIVVEDEDDDDDVQVLSIQIKEPESEKGETTGFKALERLVLEIKNLKSVKASAKAAVNEKMWNESLFHFGDFLDLIQINLHNEVMSRQNSGNGSQVPS